MVAMTTLTGPTDNNNGRKTEKSITKKKKKNESKTGWTTTTTKCSREKKKKWLSWLLYTHIKRKKKVISLLTSFSTHYIFFKLKIFQGYIVQEKLEF